MSEISVLTKMIDGTTNPLVRDALSKRLAIAEIKSLQTGTIRKFADNVSEIDVLQKMIDEEKDLITKDILVGHFRKLIR